jgi:hypothetical protein
MNNKQALLLRVNDSVIYKQEVMYVRSVVKDVKSNRLKIRLSRQIDGKSTACVSPQAISLPKKK